MVDAIEDSLLLKMNRKIQEVSFMKDTNSKSEIRIESEAD